MKLVGFLMMAMFSQSCTSGTTRTVSFAGKNVTLNEIFRAIKTQTGVSFFYDSRLVEDAKTVTINWENVRLETALNQLFKDEPVNWVLENKTITIVKRSGHVNSQPDAMK